ncbi:MAG: mycothiol synthase [Actinomycetota bacterium]|nr:mycothiol synthase [Actinomycetota bacterium]MDQ1542315.1 mycothiol synthase [Actinomycetota bacterium]
MNGLPDGTRLEAVGRLTPDQVAAITGLVDEATEADGVGPLSEHVMLHLRYGGDPSARNLLLWWDDAQLGAYAHLDVTDPVDGPSAEMVVAPSLRRRGLARALITAALEEADGRLRLWAHGGLAEAALMAEHLGFQRGRVLLQMRRSLLAPIPAVELPAGVTVRTFQPGADDEAWLAVNARAFADHPEQGAWTLSDLHQRMSEAWFDPAGFFLAERDGVLVGFHWTKVHGQDHGADHGHDPIGEVYVVGIDPSAQRIGLGRELTVIGLRYLRSLGLRQVMLYVDESNTGAIRLYESLGFSRWDVDVLFRHG